MGFNPPPPSFLKVGEMMIFYDGMKVYMNGDYPALIQRVMNGTQKQTKGWRFRKVR